MRNVQGPAALMVLLLALAAPTTALAATPGSPTITLSVQSGPPGTALTITGSGFPAGEIVAIYMDLANPYLGFPGPRADAQGSFQLAITTPGKDYGSGRVDATKVGPHQICGDTAYPGSSQPVAAKACAQFIVEAAPSPTPSIAVSHPPTAPTGLSIRFAVIAFGILIAIAAGAVVWMRRSQ